MGVKLLAKPEQVKTCDVLLRTDKPLSTWAIMNAPSAERLATRG